MKKARLYCAVFVVLFAISGFSQTVSQEERSVRTIYSRLTYAVQLGSLYESANATPNDSELVAEHVRSNELSIKLSDFNCGKISAIANANYGDLVTKPDGRDVLTIGTHSHQSNNADGTIANSEWADTPTWTEGQQTLENWNIPVSQAIDVGQRQSNNAKFSSYCSYNVAIAFQNKSANYKAMYFFGTNTDGTSIAVPIDTELGLTGGALRYFSQHPIRTGVFFHSSVASMPAVHDWMSKHSSPDATEGAN